MIRGTFEYGVQRSSVTNSPEAVVLVLFEDTDDNIELELSLSPEETRKMAQDLIETADKAEKLLAEHLKGHAS